MSHAEGPRGRGLRVVMDARMEFGGGIGRYVRSLSLHLLQRFPEIDLSLLVPTRPERPSWRDDPRVREIAYDADIYTLREQLLGTWLCRRYRKHSDVFHFPNYNAPWLMPARSVVTVHDLTHFLQPSFFPLARRVLAGLVLRRVVRSASRVIVVSEATLSALARFVPGVRDKLEVIHHGVEPVFRPMPAKTVETFKLQNGLRRFVLYVGNLKLHKNLARLVDAFARLPRQFDDVELVLVTESQTHHATLGERTRMVTDVPDERLVLWYNAAEAVVVPSLNEGFGLTALEAMACGKVVIASNIGALSEIIGQAGLLFDPHSSQALHAAIISVLSSAEQRAELASKALARAKRYSWTTAAERTMQIYERVVRG